MVSAYLCSSRTPGRYEHSRIRCVQGHQGAEKEAGFEEAQAEAVVSALGEAMGEDVATKEHVSAEIAALEARLYRHLWLMAAGIVGVTVTLVKLIP